jgi:hypothetical protein
MICHCRIWSHAEWALNFIISWLVFGSWKQWIVETFHLIMKRILSLRKAKSWKSNLVSNSSPSSDCYSNSSPSSSSSGASSVLSFFGLGCGSWYRRLILIFSSGSGRHSYPSSGSYGASSVLSFFRQDCDSWYWYCGLYMISV